MSARAWQSRRMKQYSPTDLDFMLGRAVILDEPLGSGDARPYYVWADRISPRVQLARYRRIESQRRRIARRAARRAPGPLPLSVWIDVEWIKRASRTRDFLCEYYGEWYLSDTASSATVPPTHLEGIDG